MKKLLFFLVIITGIFFLHGCNKNDFFNQDHDHPHGGGQDAKVATDWYHLQLRILTERNSALNGVYFGYMGIALYEAVRYETPNSVSLSTKLYQMPAMPGKENNRGYNWPASANAAMAAMVKYLYTGLTPANLASIDSLENAYNQKLSPGNAENFSRSQAFGRSIATAVYNWYLTDNFNPSNAGYTPPVFPGSWVPTPPAFVNGVQPYIGSARTYLVSDLTPIAPSFPAAYSELPGSDFYKIVKKDYDVSKTLTTEQKNIASFWIDQGNGTGVTVDGHNISVVTQALEQTHARLPAAAEAYAKAGLAERDASIICFRSKYTYNLVRPVTYIRKFIDTAWLPFIVTPPHPEYPAAHALVTGAVMGAIAGVLGDHVAITDHTYDFRGWAPRSYSSLSKVADEAGISRLYGGIHYLPSINAGLSIGHDIGNKIGQIKLYY